MKAFVKLMLWLVLVVIGIGSIALPVEAADQPNAADQPAVAITNWEYKWLSVEEAAEPIDRVIGVKGWVKADALHPMPSMPDGIGGALIQVKLPELDWLTPAIWFKGIRSTSIDAFREGQSMPFYHSERSYGKDAVYMLLPLFPTDSGSVLTIKLQSVKGRIAITSDILLGDYYQMEPEYVKYDVIDVIYGSALIFLALIMAVCLFFLKRQQIALWLSLCLIILCIGCMVLGYSPAFHHFAKRENGVLLSSLFDIGLLSIVPIFTLFFEIVFGGGAFGLIRKLRIAQMICSALALVTYVFDRFNIDLFGLSIIMVPLLGVSFLVQFIILSTYSISSTIKGNRDALLISIGFGLFSIAGIYNLVLYYGDNSYQLIWWKWGLLCFILSLIAVMGRQFSSNYDRIIRYSKELEMFNHELQRSEKMEIISQLAASVAHEVRNPLQVTRGFLQLMGDKSVQEKDKRFLHMAIQELDRASSIITDFLTFAKPQLEDVTLLCITEELSQIEAMMSPLATMQGAKIELEVEPNLYAMGNTAKFKQALINMVKNSLEATNRGNGWIQIIARVEDNDVVVCIADNGEGIEEEALAKLGEPYFTNKSKGTGLGLMVTFRIIEVMQGTLRFRSQKGVGTEAIIRLPSAAADSQVNEKQKRTAEA
ncbi:integral membrane sensor signal transduction histidine kinase [Paenibacillus curdlanolyticus YK9]|uniref:histidine kinase n=2 Tax=Paenibacillus curdlanolyticus TaxID=59840 RepID=E0IAM3_9BACL|nr:integral membrane sensor signal transduction histidine kinase [Paenibacillus curdlanolyticus YK9]